MTLAATPTGGATLRCDHPGCGESLDAAERPEAPHEADVDVADAAHAAGWSLALARDLCPAHTAVHENCRCRASAESQGTPRDATTFARRAPCGERASNSTSGEGRGVHAAAAHPRASAAPPGTGPIVRAAPLTDAERIALARAVERAGGYRGFAALSGVPASTVHRATTGAPITRLVRLVLLRALPALARVDAPALPGVR